MDIFPAKDEKEYESKEIALSEKHVSTTIFLDTILSGKNNTDLCPPFIPGEKSDVSTLDIEPTVSSDGSNGKLDTEKLDITNQKKRRVSLLQKSSDQTIQISPVTAAAAVVLNPLEDAGSCATEGDLSIITPRASPTLSKLEINSSSSASCGLDTIAPSLKTRKMENKVFHEEENESACCECESGGELVCCDTCIRAFHMLCLPPQYRPLEYHESSVTGHWYCPVCLYFRVHDDLEKRRGVLLTLRHPLSVPSRDCDPRTKRLRSRKLMHHAETTEPTSEEECENKTDTLTNSHKNSKRFNHQDLYRESHHHYLFEDMKKQRSELFGGQSIIDSISTIPRVPSLVPDSVEAQPATAVRTTRRTAAAAAAAADKKIDSGASSTTSSGATLGRMNVGPAFQIPHFPIPFLELQYTGRSYDRVTDNRYSRAIADTRLVYSATDWRRKAHKLGTGTPFDYKDSATLIEKDIKEESDATEKTLFDTYAALEEEYEKKQVDEEKKDFIDSEAKLISFCQLLASRWSTHCHWPYSSEYAYKILQYARFNTKVAMACVADPTFDFHTVCDPPVRPYFNKWRPKDKRSLFPSTPFPPPQHLRASYGSVGARTRLQVH